MMIYSKESILCKYHNVINDGGEGIFSFDLLMVIAQKLMNLYIAISKFHSPVTRLRSSDTHE